MRVILKEDYLQIPDGKWSALFFSSNCKYCAEVTINVKSRKVTIKGPKGELKKDFSHMPIEIKVLKMQTKKMNGLYARIRMWNGGYKQACTVTTFKSLISNMITGVTEVSYTTCFSSFSRTHSGLWQVILPKKKFKLSRHFLVCCFKFFVVCQCF